MKRKFEEITASAILDALLQIPNPLDTHEQFQQFHHLDLVHLSREEWQQELSRVRFRLLFDPAPHPWLVERLEAIKETLDERE